MHVVQVPVLADLHGMPFLDDDFASRSLLAIIIAAGPDLVLWLGRLGTGSAKLTSAPLGLSWSVQCGSRVDPQSITFSPTTGRRGTTTRAPRPAKVDPTPAEPSRPLTPFPPGKQRCGACAKAQESWAGHNCRNKQEAMKVHG